MSASWSLEIQATLGRKTSVNLFFFLNQGFIHKNSQNFLITFELRSHYGCEVQKWILKM